MEEAQKRAEEIIKRSLNQLMRIKTVVDRSIAQAQGNRMPHMELSVLAFEHEMVQSINDEWRKLDPMGVIPNFNVQNDAYNIISAMNYMMAALQMALDLNVDDAAHLISSLPRGKVRELVHRTLSLMANRQRAVEQVQQWIERASRPAPEGAPKFGMLEAACELAGVLEIPLDPNVCVHTGRDADHCPTCCTSFNSSEDEG